MLLVLGHEMTHFVRHWSHSKYQKLAKLKKQDKTIWQRLKDFVKEWHTKLKKAYEGLTPDSAEGQMVAAMVDSIDQLQQLFAEGLVEASENYKAGQDKDVKEAEPAAMAASRRAEQADRDLEAVKYSARDELTPKEYNRLTTKKPINVSKQEWAMIKSQRKTKYSSINEDDIPVIDFFKIGDYRTINKGYFYYIRNSGPDSFSVVMKKQIIPDVRRITREVIKYENRRGNETVDSNAAAEKSKRGSDRGSGERTGNGRELPENDRGTVQTGESQRDLHARKSDADSGTELKLSDRTTESVSNRSLLANALESAAVNDKERQKLQEYKEKIGEIQEAEEKLRELNAQIRELYFGEGTRDQKKIFDLRLEAKTVETVYRIASKSRLSNPMSSPHHKKPLSEGLAKDGTREAGFVADVF